MSASLNAMPGGQPSTTQPMAGPWDSPKVVTANSVPRVLPDMSEIRREKYSGIEAQFSTQGKHNGGCDPPYWLNH